MVTDARRFPHAIRGDRAPILPAPHEPAIPHEPGLDASAASISPPLPIVRGPRSGSEIVTLASREVDSTLSDIRREMESCDKSTHEDMSTDPMSSRTASLDDDREAGGAAWGLLALRADVVMAPATAEATADAMN